MTPPTKRGRHRHVPAPRCCLCKVLALLQESLPMGTWSLTSYDNLTPGWEEFDGLKVCQEFASRHRRLEQRDMPGRLDRGSIACRHPSTASVAALACPCTAGQTKAVTRGRQHSRPSACVRR